MSKKFGELKLMRTFATRLRKNGNNKFIEKTVNCTRSKYREYNKIYREALILLGIISVRDKLRNLYKKYTMKSLILAQDER